MSSPSNLYAEKIFSEHPIAFWALDDKVDYISLISEEDRSIDSWSNPGINPRSGINGGTATSDYGTLNTAPFIDSAITTLTGDLVNTQFGVIECISYDSLNSDGVIASNLNQNLSTFSVGAYVYSDSEYLSKLEIGYEYFDIVSGENVQITKSFNTSISKKWMFISETFDNPNQNTSIRIVLKITYSGGADTTDKYKFYINGLSMGQWSEEFSSTSLGTDVVSIPSGPLSSSLAVEAKSYGLQNLSGYYLLGDGNTLSAKNSSIPMVYGASNVTILSPNGDNPSLIIPGNGFFNEYGKYKQYTVEFWLRLSCDSPNEKRIFGPISGTDGLYVRGPFIILKIGNSIGTYYVGEWLRPMLIDIRYNIDSASLLINGEEVINISLDPQEITFSPKKINDIDQDWLAFYAYDDVSPIELDCVAIYPYQVSQILAKRRWVYGQGVEFPENINAAYSGTSTFIDYTFANYSNSYSYPDLGNWNQGIIENLVIENNALAAPQYSLPKVLFNDKTKEDWISALSQIQNEDYKIMSMKPGVDWAGTNGYLLVDNVDIMNGNTKAFFGVFKNMYTTPYKEIIFHLKDTSTSDYLQVSLQDRLLVYTFKYGNEITDIYTSNAQDVGQEFSVGIKFDDFAEYFGGNLPAFFGKKSSLELYVGGNDNFENSFHGNIYSIGLCTERNLSKISQYFNSKGLSIDSADIFGIDGGIPGTQYWLDIYDGELPSTTQWDVELNPERNHYSPQEVSTQSFIDFTASYTLRLSKYFENYDIGISADSYWEDYIPLTSMAKYVKDADDYSHYDLDFIQFNVNYPAPNTFIQQDSNSSWKYSDLQEKFEVPVVRSYESLDNQLFTGYDNYIDLANKTFKSYKYDTSNSVVKTYISFQYLASGANAKPSYFANTISPDKDGIVIPGSYAVAYDQYNNPIYDNFENTKYEVIDNMIIYPPQNVDFNELALVTHIEFTIPDTSQNPIRIKKLQYASQAFNDTTPNAIGTRFGTSIYPYKKSGVYYDYKSYNPFSIYKGSSPYLYLTKNSGIQLRGKYDPLVNRGLQIPVNEAKDPTHKMIALQMAIKYTEDFFPYAPTEIFQIESKNSTIKVYLVANHKDGKRAKMYAINSKTGRIENGIAFYLNGKIVKEPNISIKEWGMLGIGFSNSLNFESYSGSIRITGPILINTVSHYKTTNLQEVQQITSRPWFKVKSTGSIDFDWTFWDTSYIWNGVLVLSATSYYGASPEDIYKTYIGTNKIIVDDDRVFTLKSYEYRLLDSVVWQSSISNAV